MTRADAAVVVIRIMAIWLLLHASQYVVSAFAFSGPSTGRPDVWFGGFLLVLVAVAVGLWFGAPRLATVLLPGEASPSQVASMSSESLEQVAFSVVGMYLLATSLPNIGYWAAFAYRAARVNPEGFNASPEMYASIVRWLILLAIGTYLLLGSRGLASFVRRIRGATPTLSSTQP